MNTETTTTDFMSWAYRGYAGTGELYQWLKDQTEFTADLDHDQLLRLAMFAYNGSWALVPEDLPALIAQEEEAFAGEFSSEAEFAENFFESTGQIDQEATKYLVIDWGRTYDYSLQFDFFNYEVIDQTDGTKYRKFFWNANV